MLRDTLEGVVYSRHTVYYLFVEESSFLLLLAISHLTQHSNSLLCLMIQRNVKSKGLSGRLLSGQWKNCRLSWWKEAVPLEVFSFTTVLPECHREELCEAAVHFLMVSTYHAEPYVSPAPDFSVN